MAISTHTGEYPKGFRTTGKSKIKSDSNNCSLQRTVFDMLLLASWIVIEMHGRKPRKISLEAVVQKRSGANLNKLLEYGSVHGHFLLYRNSRIMERKNSVVAVVHIYLKAEFSIDSIIFIKTIGHLNPSFLNLFFWEKKLRILVLFSQAEYMLTQQESNCCLFICLFVEYVWGKPK